MRKDIAIGLLFIATIVTSLFFYLVLSNSNIVRREIISIEHPALSVGSVYISQLNIPPKEITEPSKVKAIHLSYGAYNSSQFSNILELVEDSQINAIIFEIKNPDGLVATKDKFHRDVLRKLLPELNKRGIYTIARMVIFQDPLLVEEAPNLAIIDSRTGAPWGDYKGVLWSDPTNREVWQYNIEIAKQTIDLGFNEVNFDYIRFPTDGDLKYAKYIALDTFKTKENAIAEFLKFARSGLGKNTVISVDVFGMTFINDQLFIGQAINSLAPYVDVLMPMPYPSHYPDGFMGFDNPAEYPYEVVHYTIDKGIKKLEKDSSVIIRSWLQDFNLGAIYDTHKIQEQIRALSELDLNTWALWNASNRYNFSAVSK